MEAGAMPGAIPPSLFPSPARPLPSPRTLTRTANTAPPPQIVLHQSSPPVDRKEQGGQVSRDLEQELQAGLVRVKMEVASDVLRSRSSSKKKRKKETGDTRVEVKTISEIRVEQRDGSEIPISETARAKRPLCHASENSRARKATKTNAKVSKTAGKKMSPIVSRSPVMNMFARKKAHSYARSPNLHARSPNSQTRSPNPSGTLKSPSLHDLSPAPSAAATNGSKRRPRKLTSIVWNDAEPIYIDGFLMQGRCKYCSIVLPASKVSEYSAEIEDNVDFLSQEPNGEEVVAHDTLSDWDEHIKIKKAGSRNELQRYLDEDFHPRTTDFDILNWWRVNSSRYPTLGRIARDVLAVPASTVASESAFSTCGRVITDHRSSLAPETVEALMCFGDWIKPKSSSEASTSYVVS